MVERVARESSSCRNCEVEAVSNTSSQYEHCTSNNSKSATDSTSAADAERHSHAYASEGATAAEDTATASTSATTR